TMNLRANANNLLSFNPICRIEGGNSIIERRYMADVCLQTSLTQPLYNFTQLAGNRFDHKINCRSVSWSGLGWTCDGYQCSSWSNQTRGLTGDVSAEYIKHQIDFFNIL